MNEEIDFILDSTKEAMDTALKHLEKQLLKSMCVYNLYI